MTVYLVGAGPGDPGLLTVRAAELLRRADVVIYDRLSAPGLLDLAPASAERIAVGKVPRGPSVPQSEINDLLVHRGLQGLLVVRLKGGDPYVFARGAEEAQALSDAGIPYEVVPGITSAIAAPAYAGIPVTQRYSSTSFTVVTGHEDPSKPETQVNWEAIAQVGGTIVILMGVSHLQHISRRLIAGGLAPDTAAAAVRWGTRSDQTVIRSTLSELHKQPLLAPCTIVVGEVASQELNWFSSRPLFGQQVVVTRSSEQAGELCSLLRTAGAAVIEVPTIAIQEPPDGGSALREAVGRLSEFEFVVLTSANAARRFCAELRDGRDLAGVRLAAIGPGTAGVLAEHHLQVDLMPERFVAEALLEVFPSAVQATSQKAMAKKPAVLIPRAEVARDVLPIGLEKLGWAVEVVTAYRTAPSELSSEVLDQVLQAQIITFASASAVKNFAAAMQGVPISAAVIAIGPITAQAVIDAGLTLKAQAKEHTLAGLVKATCEFVALSTPGTAGPSGVAGSLSEKGNPAAILPTDSLS
ncbi:MAG: uroporphyrinogen-III C-methyltransferase [Microthrixaceae bacterium]